MWHNQIFDMLYYSIDPEISLQKNTEEKINNALFGKEKPNLKKSNLTFQVMKNRIHISQDDFSKFKREKGTLYIVSHTYDAFDAFAMTTLFHNIKDKIYNVIATSRHLYNYMLKIFSRKFNVDIVLTAEGEGQGAVSKSIKKIKSGQNIVLFLGEDRRVHKKSSGAYHIAKNSKCNVVLVKIKCQQNIPEDLEKEWLGYVLVNKSDLDFDIKLEDFNYSLEDKDQYMEQLKKKLYDIE